MAKVYQRANKVLTGFLRQVIEERFRDLKTKNVQIDLMVVYDPGGPALLHHGYPCMATVKINSLKLRAQALGDATLTVDGNEWESWPPETLKAVLAHECYHLHVTNQQDDLGRPKLAMVLHDWQMGGFQQIVKWYGDFAPEKQHVQKLIDDHGQYLLDFKPTKSGSAVGDVKVTASGTGPIGRAVADTINGGNLKIAGRA